MVPQLAALKILEPENIKLLLKYIIGLIVLVLIIYGVYRLYGYIKNKIQAAKDPSQNLGIVTSNLTYSMAEFKLLADTLETAMAGPGTDEKAVSEVFNQLHTADDVKQLVKSFGIRTKGVWPFNKEMNLPQWLTDEFSQSDLAPIKQVFIENGIPF